MKFEQERGLYQPVILSAAKDLWAELKRLPPSEILRRAQDDRRRVSPGIL